MTVSVSALKGFLLEEVLSKLLENSGYTLIDKDVLNYPNKYPEFVSQGNGLNIKGRGGTHQADVLGQFPISIPFNYPIRLFLEAKFRNKRVGIDVVRSGIGILTDLNANYQTINLNSEELLVQRFNYQYAIFSTSGFSENAIRLAIAYKITLIDLSGDEYINLLRAIEEVAYRLRDVQSFKRITLKEIRANIRYRLYNTNIDEHVRRRIDYDELLSPIFSAIDSYRDLYLASINSPFSILIKPTSPEEFKYLLREYEQSTFEVSIRWNPNYPNLWKIHLYNYRRMEFTFYLPELIKKYVFESLNDPNDPNILMNALYAKKQFFSTMVFYVRSAEKFITFKYGIDERYE